MPLILESSLTRTLLSRCEKTPDAAAFGERTDTGWKEHSFRSFLDDVLAIGAALEAQGVQPGDRLALVGNTSYSLVRLQWGAITAGAIPVPLSPLQTDRELGRVFADCQPPLVCVDNQALRERLLRSSSKPLEGRALLSLEELPDLIARGQGLLAVHGRGDLQARLWNSKPESLFLLMYTSGTSGDPKGSMISQAQMMGALHDSAELFRPHLDPEHEVTLSILPLANIFGQFELAVGIVFGWKSCFATRLDRLESDLNEVQPSLIFGVPKLYERLLSGIQESIESKSVPERAIIEKLLGSMRRVAQSRSHQERPSLADTAESLLARQTVVKGIQRRLGGRLKLAISGGAPLPPSVAAELDLLGLRVLEGYGLTETCGPVAINDPTNPAFGSVGKPLPGVDLQILSDGEIALRTREPFLGYWNAEESTTEIQREGWLHTGDLGYLDGEGRLHITDRKKDLMVLSSGRNIAPQKIEKMAHALEFVEDLVVLGDGQSYLAALVTLRQNEIIKFCAERQILFSRFAELVNHPKIRSLVQSQIELLNEELAPYERIRRFVILPESLSVDSGAVTHTQKLRRRQIAELHSAAVDALFEPALATPAPALDPGEPLG